MWICSLDNLALKLCPIITSFHVWMSHLRVLISRQSLGFTFGASFSSFHFPHPQAPRPLQSPSSGKELQWPRYVSKHSGCKMAERSADSLLRLPPPFCFLSSTVSVPLSTTRGRDEAGVCSFNWLSYPWKEETDGFFLSCSFLQAMHHTGLSQTWWSLGNGLIVGQTLMLFLCIWP